MRLLIQISLLVYSINSFGQTEKTTTIELSTGDCRKNEVHSFPGSDTIRFFKLPGNTLVYKIVPRDFSKWPIKIENALTGRYRVTYKNNYRQQVIEEITLTEQDLNEVVICPDKLLAYPQNTLAKLQDKDSISINFHSQGCFHTDFSRLTITKEGHKFIARLYQVLWAYVKKNGNTAMQTREGQLLNILTMTNEQIQDFTRFENELNYVRFGGCTTTDIYDVKSKYLNIKKKDDTCKWDGFYHLKKSLFGEKN